jgi:choline dehydrogenase-like flavoprotein
VTLTDDDLRRMRAGGKTLVRAFFAAGATAVVPGVAPSRFIADEAAALAAVDTLTSQSMLAQAYASHPHGTCRVGPKDGPDKGVVDVDGKVHGVDGAYVMDGAVFPSTLGVNPQITIMATALALSRKLLA